MIETCWKMEIKEDFSILLEWTYGEVMANITQPPITEAMCKDMALNMTYDNWETI